MIFDDTVCTLGEGALWHPIRKSLFWFDILGMKLFERAPKDDKAMVWEFDEHISAAGWVDETTLLIASETALSTFDIATGESVYMVGLESDNEITRSNDGRADPYGGFWIGTMGKNAEHGAGSIYRYFDGELRKLYPNISISNAICFAPDGKTAYFTDTPTQIIMRVALDDDGWPAKKPELHIDMRDTEYRPDGAVIDADGNLWNAQWGASRVARYDNTGSFIDAVHFSASQISCPTFGGDLMMTLFATSAAEGLHEPIPSETGMTFHANTTIRGQAEHQVILG